MTASPATLPPPEFEGVKILADLFEAEIDLPPCDKRRNPRVTIYNQGWRIPKDDGLFINVAIIGSRPFGANRKIVDDPTSLAGMTEVLSASVQESYQVEAYSRDGSARERKIELLWALRSTLAQQLSEKHSFKLGRLPTSFVDVSTGEGSSRLNRYALTINLLRSFSRVRAIEAFTEFQNPPEQLIVNP